jgi:hypothetical protein
VVCRTPLGFPVVPEVYRMYRGCSLSRGSAGHVAAEEATSSCHHTSRPGLMGTSLPARRSTTTFSTDGQLSRAWSANCLRGTTWPRRHAPSWVMRTLAWASWIRPARASALNPPKTTLWTAPMRAQASMAMGSSGTMPM